MLSNQVIGIKITRARKLFEEKVKSEGENDPKAVEFCNILFELTENLLYNLNDIAACALEEQARQRAKE